MKLKKMSFLPLRLGIKLVLIFSLVFFLTESPVYAAQLPIKCYHIIGFTICVPGYMPPKQPKPTPTRKPTRKPTPTVKPTNTPIPTATPTNTPTPNPTNTPVPTATVIPTPTPTTQPSYTLSDSGWKVNKSLINNWVESGFDDSSWGNSVSPSDGNCSIDAINTDARLWPDHGGFPMWGPNPTSGETIYFRKTITIPSFQTALFRAVFDDDGEIYVNGTLVYQDHSGMVNTPPIVTGDITKYFSTGDNTIAIKGIDVQPNCESVQFELTVQ